LPRPQVVELIRGAERAIAAGATVDNAQLIHRVGLMGSSPPNRPRYFEDSLPTFEPHVPLPVNEMDMCSDACGGRTTHSQFGAHTCTRDSHTVGPGIKHSDYHRVAFNQKKETVERHFQQFLSNFCQVLPLLIAPQCAKSVSGFRLLTTLHGYNQVLRAVHDMLALGRLPTPELVLHVVTQATGLEQQYARFCLREGGRVEFALDADTPCCLRRRTTSRPGSSR